MRPLLVAAGRAAAGVRAGGPAVIVTRCRRRRRAWPAPRCRASWPAARPPGRASAVTTSGRRDRTRGSSTPSPARRRRHPISAAVAGDSRATGAARGAGQVGLAVLQPPVVEQQVPGREHRRRPRRGCGGSAAPDVGGAGARALPGVELGDLAADPLDAAQAERRRPCASASASSARKSGIAVVRSAAPEVRASGPPSRRTCRPSPAAGATGRTTSARSGDLARPHLEADHEAGRVERRERRRRVGQVVRVDAADDERAEVGPRRPRRGSPAVSRPGRTGSAGDVPDGRDVDAGGGVGDRAAAGQQARAARRPRRAPRSPARRGTQAEPGTGRRGQPQRRRTGRRARSASRSPTRITAPGGAQAPRRPRRPRRARVGDGVEHLGLGARRGRR